MAYFTEDFLETVRNDAETEAAPGLSAAVIEAAQREVGFRFPPSYVQFLRLFNGGEFRYVLIHHVDTEAAREEAEQAEADLDRVGGLTEWAETARDLVPEIAEGRIYPFGRDWAGSYFCFDTSQPGPDAEYPVLIWNHEYAEDPESASLLWGRQADNFALFLENVYGDDDLYGDEDEDEEEEELEEDDEM
ncbi:MAG TPA: SMI1/KNR4 family protein [Armatimonadaceae bacterium]|nr:SMI1/KNR4 family protein [Armatimonadaceae bacterium]